MNMREGINWIKKNWTDPVWSKVFGGLILAFVLWIISKIFKIVNPIINTDKISKLIGTINQFLSRETSVSNLTLMILLLFVAIVITFLILKIIGRKWLGRTNNYYSSSKCFIVRGTYSMNLDVGIQAKNRADSDFLWEQIDITRRNIVPQNGAKFCVIGQKQFNSINKSELQKLSYSLSPIRADNNNSNQIPNGTYIGYLTKENRYGLMKIVKYEYDLEIEFKTYK